MRNSVCLAFSIHQTQNVKVFDALSCETGLKRCLTSVAAFDAAVDGRVSASVTLN